MRYWLKYFIIVFCAWGTNLLFAQPFVHPGIDQNEADLKYMKQQVLAGKEPWKQAFDLLKEETSLNFQFQPYSHVISGPYAKPDVGGNELSRCSRMTYQCAVLWYLTGDKRYAEMAIDIIEQWSNTLRSFDENNAKLLVALTGYEFCNAAEILRYHYEGWTEKQTESATRLLMSAYYPTIRYYFSEANGNWDGAIMHTLLAIAVFTDNRALFDNAVYHYLHAPANGSLIKYVYPNGQCQETQRDQGHVQMGLYEFSGAARIAYTQGVDLFSAADYRLALGLEYSAKFITGGSVFAYGVPSERERFKYRSGFEYCLDHFTAKGIDMPNLRELCSRTKLNNAAAALWKLTAYRAEFINKPSQLKILQPSMIAYPAGAKVNEIVKQEEGMVTVNSGEDLQAIVDQYAGTGKTILLRAGEYRLSKSLLLPSDVHILGEGRKTVLLCEPSVRTAAILLGNLNAHNVTIENLVLDGAKTHDVGSDPNTGRFNRSGRLSNQISGISLRGEPQHDLQNIVLRNLTVINFSRTGVYLSDVRGIRIESCDFTENGSQVIPGPRLLHNLHVQHSKDIQIRDSRFDTSLRGCGIVLDHCQDVLVEQCEIARNGWHGVLMSENQHSTIKNCLIEGNDGCGFMGEYLYHGSENVTVCDNLIQYNNGFGVKVYAIANLSIARNVYRSNEVGQQQEYISSEKALQLEQLHEQRR